MPVVHLNDSFISQASCPVGSFHMEYCDVLIKGFFLDVMASGHSSYRVRYQRNGKREIMTIGDARILTLTEAREQARSIIKKVLSGQDPKQKNASQCSFTLEHFFRQRYLPFVKTYKRSWITDAGIIQNHILPLLGAKLMAAVEPSDITFLVNYLKRRSYALSTINRVLIILRYGYTLAQRWQEEGITCNPCCEIKNFKVDNRIERFLSSAQKDELIACVKESKNPLLGDIVSFLLLTGARKREVLDARWVDIDLEAGIWRIPKTKSGKIRHVPLSSSATHLLTQLRQKIEPKSPLLFPNPKTGRAFVSIFTSWNTARRAAGLPDLRIHDLRHSFASFLVNAGRTIYEVQELLGHADARTTSRYAHLSRDRLRTAVECVVIS